MRRSFYLLPLILLVWTAGYVFLSGGLMSRGEYEYKHSRDIFQRRGYTWHQIRKWREAGEPYKALFENDTAGTLHIEDSLRHVPEMLFYYDMFRGTPAPATRLYIGSDVEDIHEYAFMYWDIKHITVNPRNKHYEVRDGGLYDRRTGAIIAPESKRQRTLRSKADELWERMMNFYYRHTVSTWFWFILLCVLPGLVILWFDMPWVRRAKAERLRAEAERKAEEQRQREEKERKYKERMRALIAEMGEPTAQVSWGDMDWEKQLLYFEDQRKVCVGGQIFDIRFYSCYFYNSYERVPGEVIHQSDPVQTLLYTTMGFLTNQFYGATAGYYASKWSESDLVEPDTVRTRHSCEFSLYDGDRKVEMKVDIGYDLQRYREFSDIDNMIEDRKKKDHDEDYYSMLRHFREMGIE